MTSITAIFQNLQRTQSALQLSLINTRVMLETGINLRSVTAEQDSDATAVAKVTMVLRGMGMTA